MTPSVSTTERSSRARTSRQAENGSGVSPSRNCLVSSQSPRFLSKSLNHSPRSGCGPMTIRFRAAPPVKANARMRDRRGPSPQQEYAHRLWHEGHLSQMEIAQEIQRLFHVPFAQSQVSRAIKLVDHWLQSIKADSPAKARPAVPHGGTKPKRAQHARNRQAPGAKKSTIATTDCAKPA